jgi:hypothetical protein
MRHILGIRASMIEIAKKCLPDLVVREVYYLILKLLFIELVILWDKFIFIFLIYLLRM